MKGSLPKMAMMIMLIIAVSVVVITIVSMIVLNLVANQNQQPVETLSPNTEANVVLLEYPMKKQYLSDLTDQRFVQMNIVLRYPERKTKTWFGLMEEVDETILTALTNKNTEIEDAIYTLLRNKSSADLRGDALARTKAEMVAQINKILPTDAQIRDVLFNDIKVQ